MKNSFKSNYPFLDTCVYAKHNDWGRHYTEAERRATGDAYLKYLNDNQSISADLRNYVTCRLHDSDVLAIESEPTRASLTVNDFFTKCFADAVAHRLHGSSLGKRFVFPVRFDFTGLRKFNVAWVNRNGKILRLNTKNYIGQLEVLLYEQVIAARKDHFSIGLLFWRRKSGNKSEVLIEIECAVVEVIEVQKNCFLRAFDGQHEELFDEYWRRRVAGTCFDYSVAMSMLDEK